MTEIAPVKTIAAHCGSPETEPDIEILAVFIKPANKMVSVYYSHTL